jgi:hypothetical protein
MIEPTITAAIISAFLTAMGLLFGYIQWRRDVKIKLGQIRETVSVELIRQRIEPYSVFYKQLEVMSSIHSEELQANPEKVRQYAEMLQDNMYGTVGLISSHETRLILIYVRLGCKEFVEGKIGFSDFRLRLWALHFSLRSDLGISQPFWSSEVERIRAKAISIEERTISELVESYPWNKVLNNQVGKERKPQENT